MNTYKVNVNIALNLDTSITVAATDYRSAKQTAVRLAQEIYLDDGIALQHTTITPGIATLEEPVQPSYNRLHELRTTNEEQSSGGYISMKEIYASTSGVEANTRNMTSPECTSTGYTRLTA
ncbi:hypothetical protein CMI37_08745 [Candidatus Pacearchaeota archaeon]|nr:hypothetical protein [Candidatus Pacearchaeota archaeon]|tara:strand:+ start:1246 stop:1608 length:363 start_codon:yes stop_codon:yes gene_type:complete